MATLRLALLALLGSAAVSGPTVDRVPVVPSAQDLNQWQNAGPSESSITRITPDPSSPDEIYCIADSAVFKTIDGGERWSPLNLQSGIADVAIDPSNSRVLLAAPASSSPFVIFKSSDGGETWSPRSVTASFSRIIWDGRRPNRVFLFEPNSNSVVRSFDEGDNWMPLTPAPPGQVTALAIDSASGSLFAATSAGISRLDLDALNWIPLAGPFPTGTVTEIDIDPAQPSVQYAITTTGFPRVYRTLDSGIHWTTPELDIGTPSVTTLVIDPLHTEILYGGGQTVVRSEDGAVTWNDYDAALNVGGQRPGNIQTLALGPTGILYSGTPSGFFRRGNNDPGWAVANRGLPGGVSIASIAVGAPPALYAAGRTGVWVSEDSAAQWSLTSPIFLEASPAIAADPSTPGTAYAGTEICEPRPPYSCFGYLYKTTDAGAHWQSLPVPSELGPVLVIAVDPGRPQVLFAAGYGPLGFRSLDGGTTWQALTNGFPTDAVTKILIDVRAPDSIYVGTSNQGIFESSDGGGSWSPTDFGNLQVTALAQDARNGILYAGSDTGLFRSGDGGGSWTFLAFPQGVRALAVNPRSGTLFVATATEGILESLDEGQSWSTVGSGLPEVTVSDLAFSPGGSILYAATATGIEVFASREPRALGFR